MNTPTTERDLGTGDGTTTVFKVATHIRVDANVTYTSDATAAGPLYSSYGTRTNH
jgi:hypothetical protein